MANKKINELQSRVPSLTDLLLVGDPSSGYSYKCTVSELATIIETDISDNFVTLTTTQSISGAKTFSNILTLTSVANATTDPDKFLVLNASNVVNYRTGSEVLSDIGGQGALTLTTTGTSGAATLVGNTLNIPQYQSVLTNPVTGTGTTNYVTKFTATSTVGDSSIQDNGTAVTTTSSFKADSLTSEKFLQIKQLNTGYSLSGYTTLTSNSVSKSFTFNFGDGVRFATFNFANGDYIYTLPSATGTLALTSDITSAVLGTTNYIPKFTSSFSIGNSIIYETSSNIGISTTSPSYKLDVNGDLRVSTIANATTDTDRFLVSDSGVIKYRTGSELLSDIGGQAALTNPVTGTGTTNYIPKFTGTSAIGNSNLQTDASGNLGLGVTPSAWALKAFQIAAGAVAGGNAGQGIAIVRNAYFDGSWKYYASSTASIYEQDAGQHIWKTAPSGTAGNAITFTQAMTLDASGRLGIGTTSPTARLHVLANDGLNEGVAAAIIRQGGSAGNNGILIDVTNTPNAYVADFRINNSSVMRLDASGNLGIGTTSPTSITNYTALTINGTSGSFTEYQQGGSYAFRIGSDNSEGGFISQTTNNPIRIFTNSNERMRITSGGNVGIGTTTPGSKLAVVGLPTSTTGLAAGDFYRDGDGYVLVVL
jgi:hypothetical protein